MTAESPVHLLIDHTTAHSLDLTARDRDWQDATRAVLQFVEELCVAKEMWISDTESGDTLMTSMAVRQMVEDAGLVTAEEAPLLRTAVVSDAEFRTVLLPRAAGALYGTLFEMASAGDLHRQLSTAGDRLTGEIRASVHAAQSIPSQIHGLRWDTPDRVARAEELAANRERGSAAALLLLNQPLFRWAKDYADQHPDDKSPAYRHLHLLSRWHINLQLAEYASRHTVDELNYAPAYARAHLLAATYLPKRVAKLHFLQQRLWETFLAYGAVQYGGARPQAVTLPLPLIGAGVVLSLPVNAELSDLMKVIGEVRASDFGIALRDLMSDRRSLFDIDELVKRLCKKLQLSNATAGAMKARYTFMTTPPFIKGEFVLEKDLSGYGNASMSDILAYLYSRPDMTMLTPFIEDVFAEKSLASEVVSRVAHMLRLAA